MPVIPLGQSEWQSPSENVPALTLRNMYVSENMSSPDGLSRISRPTLTRIKQVGTGPIKGFWRQDATFGGQALVVSGTELFLVNLILGTEEKIGDLPGTGYCQFAGTADRVLIVRDKTCYSTDGEDLSVVVLPDDVPPYEGSNAPVSSVAVINSTFILTIEGIQRFYWINPDEVDPDPLNFASAERLPDPIVAVAILTDEIWFLGTQGPEVWSTTTDPDIPFQRINGRVYNEGCVSRDTVVQSVANDNPCLLWVTQVGTVVLAQGSPKKVSTLSIEEGLKTATSLRAWTFRSNKHDFYVLTSNEFTYVYDITRGEWATWDSYLSAAFVGHLGIQDGTLPYAGSAKSGLLYKMVEGEDDDGDQVVREVSGIIHNPGKPYNCSSVAVRVNAGWAKDYEKEPQLEMRWSDDQGATYSDYVRIGLGVRGLYAADTIFRSLGLINRPGRVFEFRFSDKARFRIDYAVMNEV